MSQKGTGMGDVMLQKDDNKHVWHLVRKEGDDELEKLVFACNSVIGEAELPPVIRSPGYVVELRERMEG